MTVRSFAREHTWALGLAFVASVIVAFPQVYFRIDHASDGVYQGIELLPDSPWSARVREIQDGHNLGSIYYKDGKENPYLFQPVGSMVVAYMGKLFSFDINNTLLLSRFVLTFATFMLIYGFVWLVFRDKFVALSSAAALLLAESILSYSGLAFLLQGVSPDDFLRIARPVNPAMIYILLFGFLSTFWMFYRSWQWRWGIASAILLGLNFYNYFYTWTYLFAVGGVLGLILLIQKKWNEAFSVAGVYLGALVFAIPYIYNLYSITTHPAYEEVGLRNGIVHTHDLIFVGFVVLAALSVYLLFFPREDKSKYLFGLAILLAPFITLNQQLLTGKVLQPFHYHWFFHKPLALVCVLATMFIVLARFTPNHGRQLIAILFIAGCFGVGAFTQIASYSSGTRDGGAVAIERQKYGPVLRWLNEHAKKEEVVMANNEASHMVAIYTPLNLFYHRAGMYSLASTKERLLNQQFAFYRLRGVDDERAKEVFFAERGSLSGTIYGMHYRELLGTYEAIPDAEIEDIIARYRATVSIPATEWLSNTFAMYEVSYFIWDTKKDPNWNLDQYSFTQKVAEFGDLHVYRFVQ